MYDVNLPKSHSPVFPERCVRCGANSESYSLRIWTHSIGWWTVLGVFGRGFKVRVPACRGCGLRIRVQRVGELIAIFTITILVMFFVGPFLDEVVPRALRRWVAVGLVVVCMSPWFFWENFFPPYIGMTAYSKSVDYEFRDFDYASDFAELNSDAEWVKIE